MLGLRRWQVGALLLGVTAVAAVAVVVATDRARTAPVAPQVDPSTWPAATAASGPLRVSPDNGRYFVDGRGDAVYLTGSHTWANLQDAGQSDPPPVFDYAAYLDLLETYHHNFFRLWTWEQASGAGWEAGGIWFGPMPYERPGPGSALDDSPKYDLTRLDQAYFDRMRERVVAAGERGVYVSIMLFDGFSLGPKNDDDAGNPWPGHPFNARNNVNGIDGDADGDGYGYEVHTLRDPDVTAVQEAYVRKVIDTVNDLDNVLYEISNESNHGSQETAWQYHMIDYIHDYEAGKPKHPVGMTVAFPEGDNDELFESPAEWVSPNADGGYKDSPPVADGRKVVILDTDHLWGLGGDHQWVWKSFTRGYNIIYMDCYNDTYCDGFDPNDPVRVSVLVSMGKSLAYAQSVNLAQMRPRDDVCSSGYCLARSTADEAEYLVYGPDGGTLSVDLSGTTGEVAVEWFNPRTGATVAGEPVAAGARRSFDPPFSGDAVLYLHTP